MLEKEMTLRRALDILDNIDAEKWTKEEKVEAVDKILKVNKEINLQLRKNDMIHKDELFNAIRWLRTLI